MSDPYQIEKSVCPGCQTTYWPKFFTGVWNDAEREVSGVPAWQRETHAITNDSPEPLRRMWHAFAHENGSSMREVFDGAWGVWRWFHFLMTGDGFSCGKPRCHAIVRMSHVDQHGNIGC